MSCMYTSKGIVHSRVWYWMYLSTLRLDVSLWRLVNCSLPYHYWFKSSFYETWVYAWIAKLLNNQLVGVKSVKLDFNYSLHFSGADYDWTHESWEINWTIIVSNIYYWEVTELCNSLCHLTSPYCCSVHTDFSTWHCLQLLPNKCH